jgi:hypothetical protein
VVRPLVFCCRQFALLALCYLFSRQVMYVATRKSDILYTYSVVAFCLARKKAIGSEISVWPESLVAVCNDTHESIKIPEKRKNAKVFCRRLELMTEMY